MIKLGFVFVGGRTFDGAGRRVGLTISLAGCGVSLLVVSIAYFIMDEDVQEDLPSTKATIAVLAGICCYLSFFSIGMGPGAWLIPSEVFSNVIRAKAMSLAAFGSRVYATVMASTFLSVANAIGYSGFFLLLSVACFLVLSFFWMYLPETKGMSLEDMSLYFAEVTGDRTLLEAEQELSHMPKGQADATEGDMNGDDSERSTNRSLPIDAASESLPPVV